MTIRYLHHTVTKSSFFFSLNCIITQLFKLFISASCLFGDLYQNFIQMSRSIKDRDLIRHHQGMISDNDNA